MLFFRFHNARRSALLFIALTAAFSSAQAASNRNQKAPKMPSPILAPARLAPERLASTRGGVPVAGEINLAKFEPEKGCYIGAFIERDQTVRGNISLFETLTKKKHASYFTYVGYGCVFPSDWVAKVKRAGAAPQIAFEPNHGLREVKDDAYLRDFARDAARSKVPIFLRFASEMNGPWMWKSYFEGDGKTRGNPAEYIAKFRLVAKVMRQEAPNVAMVWTPFAEPVKFIDEYYPGDDAVDWVGVNVYSVYVNNGDPSRPAMNRDPLDFLRHVYDTYAARKPVHVSEFATTLHCKGTNLDTTDFAMEKMTRFYSGIAKEFPRVKSVNYFCLDTVQAGLANNNYSFMQDGRVLATYRNLIGNANFLDTVPFDAATYNKPIKAGTTIGDGGVRLRASTSELELLAETGSVVASLQEPRLRGVFNAEVKNGDFTLRVQLPEGVEPRGFLWQVDGRTVAITNVEPYRYVVSREKFGAGPHTARVVVLNRASGAPQIPSPPVDFSFAP